VFFIFLHCKEVLTEYLKLSYIISKPQLQMAQNKSQVAEDLQICTIINLVVGESISMFSWHIFSYTINCRVGLFH